jgi:hypothetical protein
MVRWVLCNRATPPVAQKVAQKDRLAQPADRLTRCTILSAKTHKSLVQPADRLTMHHLECDYSHKHTNQHPSRCIMTSLPKRACKIPGQEDCVSFINFLGHDTTTRQQVDEFLEHEMGTISSQNKKTWLPTVPFPFLHYSIASTTSSFHTSPNPLRRLV